MASSEYNQAQARYEQMIKHNRQKANCIAEYEGVWMAQAILDRARKRLD